jgi:hypothetical protein
MGEQIFATVRLEECELLVSGKNESGRSTSAQAALKLVKGFWKSW